MSTEEASLGLATTRELIAELAARAEVASTIGEMWPGYSTVGGYATEEQLKPAIEEPELFGSIVRAREDAGRERLQLWQKTPFQGKHYWESETGATTVWSELTDVEVLRVGIGETLPRPVEELVGVLTDPNWGRPRRFCSLRRDCRMTDGHSGGCQP